MSDYELILILDPDLTSEKQKKITDTIKKAVESLKGKTVKVNEWGRKEFSYPIRKKTSGVYYSLEIELEPKSTAVLERKIKVEEELLRFLLVKKETTPKRPKRKISSKRKGGE